MIFRVLLLSLIVLFLNADTVKVELTALNNKLLFENQLANNRLHFTVEEQAYLKAHPVLKVQNLKTFAPFNFQENGQAKGYSVDYLKLMAKYMGVQLQFISNKQWHEYLRMLQRNELDIIPHISRTPERENFITFTNFNHLEHITGMAQNKNQSYSSMKDLKNKTIAVVEKTFLHAHMQKNFPKQKLYLAKQTNFAVEAVSLGKADAVIASLPSLDYYIQKNWYTNLKTSHIEGFQTSVRTALPMGIAKDNFVLKSILEKVNQIIPQSEVLHLKKKWMNIQKVDETGLTKDEINFLQKKKRIKICVLPNWLPFEQIDENKEHRGIGRDIMNLVSTYINTPIQLVPTDEWSQSLQNIRDRKCDMLPVAMDVPSRRDAMNFTKPYHAEPFVIATQSDEFFIKDVKSIGKRKVGVVKSYAFINVLKNNNPNLQIVEVKNAKDGLQRVQNGELFGYIDIMAAIGYTIQKYGMIDLKIAGKLEHDIKLSIATRNDEPLLNTIMQKALNKIDDKQMRMIIGRWIEIKVHQEFDYTKLFYVIGFFTLLIVLILYKNRSINSINKQLEKANQAIKEQQKMVDKYVLIVDTNLDGIIINANEAYCKATGYSKNDLLGKSHKMMQHPSMTNEFFEHLWSTISSNLSWQGEIVNYTKDKEVKYFNMVIEPYFKEGVKVGYRSISEDITDKKRIEELSITDKLTGLFNRMKLDEVLTMKMEEFKRYNVIFSVILLDVDNFKMINDQHGHDVGDDVLKYLAYILQNNTRATDIVGRWGGEEFLIICDNTNDANAMVLAENLRAAVELETIGKVQHMTISLGITQFMKEDTITTCFKRVDKALYEAKNNGKNKAILK